MGVCEREAGGEEAVCVWGRIKLVSTHTQFYHSVDSDLVFIKFA